MKSKIGQIIIIVIVDCCIVAFSASMPLLLRFGIFTVDQTYLSRMLMCLPIDMAIAVAVLAFFKLYNRIWSFAGVSEVVDALKASLVIEALFIAYRMIFTIPMPRSYYLFEWVFLFLLLAASRLSVRLFRQVVRKNEKIEKINRVMIVGAGSAASILIDEIRNRRDGRVVVCLVDDNKQKTGKYTAGVLVAGTRHDIPRLVEKNKIETVIIAMPSESKRTIREIIEICKETPAKIQIIPAFASNMDAVGNKVRDINYEDLLGRNRIEIKNENLEGFLLGKTVLVTGAGGSIGSELCRQIAINKPGKLIMFDIYENSLYDISTELNKVFPNIDIDTIIGSVRDEKRIEELLSGYLPDVIYHAAAHKHVPLMEDSPCEAVKNNCGGTLTLSKLASKYNVSDFILISTDKAVRPTNVMGASKRICEMIVQSYNKMSDTRFVAVRFGNVLGSNGSVVPMFLKQIDDGGPVTLTHKDVTRFFMTISEAVSLVLQAGIPDKKGELFVLDMGEPIKIYDLAVNLIKLKGHVPDDDIKIAVTGLRPGEKLYEELLMDEEGLESTHNDLIFVGKSLEIDIDVFFKKLEVLLEKAYINDENIKEEITLVCDNFVLK